VKWNSSWIPRGPRGCRDTPPSVPVLFLTRGGPPQAEPSFLAPPLFPTPVPDRSKFTCLKLAPTLVDPDKIPHRGPFGDLVLYLPAGHPSKAIFGPGKAS